MSTKTPMAGPDRARPKTTPFSIRLTEDEKRLLMQRAGAMSLGAYLRNLVLEAGVRAPRPPARKPRSPVKDQEALARVLAALGKSRIANNLNQLARAANIGTLPLTPETEQDLLEACAMVARMRQDLMAALGFVERGEP